MMTMANPLKEADVALDTGQVLIRCTAPEHVQRAVPGARGWLRHVQGRGSPAGAGGMEEREVVQRVERV